ncbi:MAG: InlB B-repeat-containing protein [Oscillospiraceae bacterium]|nr:InlB B-repeat-containing protein [Oscillospiraceae bacterium]
MATGTASLIERNNATGHYTVQCTHTFESSWKTQLVINTSSAAHNAGTQIASGSGVKKLTGTKEYTGQSYGQTTVTATWYFWVQGNSWQRADSASFSQNVPACQFTVTFDANGGNTPSMAGKTVTYGSTYGALAVCTRTGYTFAGWFTAADGGTQITGADTVAITADTTLYARWTANSYTGTFDLRGGKIGGSGENQTRTETYDAAWVLPPDPTRAGYTFSGWYTAPTGGTQVTGETIYAGAGPQTLYARWTGNAYTCSFDARGGTVSPGSKSVTCGSAYGELPVPERSGYAFLGWYPTIYSESRITETTTVTATADHTIYARWEAMSVLHLAENGEAKTVTDIQVVDGGTVRNIVGCWSVENGVVRQGV